MTIKPIDAYRKLLSLYSPIWDRSRSEQYELEKALREGKQIPDHCLPGRALKHLSDEEREALKQLTSEEVEKEQNPFTYYKS